MLIDNIRNIKAYPRPKLFIGNDTTICGDEEFILDASAVSGPFLWQDGSTNSTFPVTKSGTYWVEAYDDGCKTTDTIQVIVNEPFAVDLGPDQLICEGEFVNLSLDIPDASYKWSNLSTSSTISITESGKYWVEVARGTCIRTDTVHVVFRSCRFKIPNIITPNGDNRNDRFEILDDLQGSWALEVYNRWGKLIFSDKNYNNTWDGNGAADGTYFYLLKSNSSEQTYKGTVTISR